MSQLYRCDICSQIFTGSNEFIKHKCKEIRLMEIDDCSQCVHASGVHKLQCLHPKTELRAIPPKVLNGTVSFPDFCPLESKTDTIFNKGKPKKGE
jgi:hypothetical protein